MMKSIVTDTHGGGKWGVWGVGVDFVLSMFAPEAIAVARFPSENPPFPLRGLQQICVDVFAVRQINKVISSEP